MRSRSACLLERQVHDCVGIDTEGKPSAVVQIAVGNLCVIWPAEDALELMRVLKESEAKVGVLGAHDDIIPAMCQVSLELIDVRKIIKEQKMVNPYNTPSLLDCYEAVARSEKYYYCKPDGNMHWADAVSKRLEGREGRKWRVGPGWLWRAVDGVEIQYVDPNGVEQTFACAPDGGSVWSSKVRRAIRTSEKVESKHV